MDKRIELNEGDYEDLLNILGDAVTYADAAVVGTYQKLLDHIEATAEDVGPSLEGELLAALKEVTDLLDEYAEDWDEDSLGLHMIADARAAIAKAEGRAAR